MTWYTRYTFQMIEKFQRENIKAFEPKQKCVKDLYNHTHELMKRLVWSSRKSTMGQGSDYTNMYHSMPIVVQEWEDSRPRYRDLSRKPPALLRGSKECTLGGL